MLLVPTGRYILEYVHVPVRAIGRHTKLCKLFNKYAPQSKMK